MLLGIVLIEEMIYLKKLRFFTSLLLTILAWMVIISGNFFALRDIIRSSKEAGTNFYPSKYLKISISIALLWTFLNLVWIIYNKKHFGTMNRRTFKKEVSNQELADYFEIDLLKIEGLQNNNYTFLDDTLIDYKRLDKKENMKNSNKASSQK